MKENTMATNFEPHKCVINIFVQSTKFGTDENKAIHSPLCVDFCRELYLDEPPPPDSGFLGIGAKKPKVAATQITIIKAEGLEVQDRDGCMYNHCAHT